MNRVALYWGSVLCELTMTGIFQGVQTLDNIWSSIKDIYPLAVPGLEPWFIDPLSVSDYGTKK